MKILRLVLLFVLLAMVRKATPQPFDDLGYPYIVTDTNDDSDSCIVNLTYSLDPEKITFNATIVNKPVSQCTHHNFQYWSLFRGDHLSGNLTLAPTDDPDVFSGDLTLADIANYNGTSCMYSGSIAGANNESYYYNCYFRYNNLYFNIDFGLDNVTGKISTDWINQFNPNEPAMIQGSKGNYTIWKPNATFPEIVGMLTADQCDNQYNNRVSNLSSEAFITGTNQASNNINLHNYLNGYMFNAVWVRANNTNNATKLPYSVFYPPGEHYQFNSNSSGACVDFLFKYSDFISSLDQCKDGCAVTEIVVNSDGNLYVLQTNGITTVPARNLRS